jgi:hypothetical protein
VGEDKNHPPEADGSGKGEDDYQYGEKYQQ